MTYDMVDETYNVQKCTQVSDRVCDTVYDLAVSVLTLCWGMVGNIVLFNFIFVLYNFSFEGKVAVNLYPSFPEILNQLWFLQKTSKDDFQCVDLKNNNCWDEEKVNCFIVVS